ncbi:hypothetical protein ALC56_09026 [Trachymyrmex septentrionalis]|uniref:Tubulin epsilon and delta complex protein 1 domain-containing protein n=1 Tax=Trachymyrmex septentrionalis TaxID=34720 RepID=A0A151JV67_9HYME|nr:PREDICTED: uncharacterized protein LOC108750873 isoform X1 [Trachymyrmex septentrionalis]KYN36601.1 hypothetical protein ALC56_09026 [Trachymyrmex septentrionalis]
MCDIKDALPTLCEHINSLINIGLTPEHLRLAKYNAPDEIVAEKLWSTLRILSYYAAREKRGDIDFRNYDAPSAVKLHLALLQYPVIEFYSLSQDGEHNRDALIAIAWLVGTQDVLTAILRAKLVDGVLGAECSHVDSSESIQPPSLIAVPNNQPLSTSAQLSSILHLNATVNLNLREINELIRERAKLISKVHAASINVSGLPHLSVSELVLTKRLSRTRILDDGGGGSSENDRRRLREYREAGILLDVRAKWLRKRHVFFDWMATVIQEHRRSTELNPRIINTRELAAFSSLLRHVIRDKLRDFKTEKTIDGGARNLNCPSRAHRSQYNNAEAQSWLDDLNERQDREGENFQRNRQRLADELEEMLKLIPSVIRV